MKQRLSRWLMSWLFGLGLILLIAAIPGTLARVTLARSPNTDVGGEIVIDTTWSLANSPYTVTSDVIVQNGITLTVEPGVEVRFNNNTGLYVHGAVRAVGTVAQPITFTSSSATPVPGQWDGLFFETDSDDSRNLLDYATVSYGGGTTHWYGAYYYTNIGVLDASPTIQHTTSAHSMGEGLWAGSTHLTLSQNTFEHNAGNGVFVKSTDLTLSDSLLRQNGGNGLLVSAVGVVLTPTLTGNTIISNTGHAIYLDYANGAGLPVVNGNTLLGNNGLNGVGVGGALGYSMTWPADYGLPRAVATDLIINAGVELTLEPGAEMRFNNNTGLYVHGAVRAVGTVAQPITFTSSSATPVPGQWDGLFFETDSDDSRNLLDYTTVSYGGGTTHWYGAYYYTNIGVLDASPTIQHTTSAHSMGDGLWAGSTHLTLSQSTFEYNAGNGVYTVNSTLHIEDGTHRNNGNAGILVQDSTATIESCTLTGNTHFGIANVSPSPSVQARYNWWGHPSGPHNPDTNPDGLGNAVSNNVIYDPWLIASEARTPIPLTLDQVISGTVMPQGYVDYRLEAQPGQNLFVEVAAESDTANLWVFSQPGTLPDWIHFDQRVQSTASDGKYYIPIVNSLGGQLYLSIYGHEVPPIGEPYTIVVHPVGQTLVDVTPHSAGNAGQVTLELFGLPFVDGLQIQLRQIGQPPITADQVTLESPTHLRAHFDLQGMSIGSYDVVTHWPAGGEASLPGAFTITPGVGYHLEDRLVVPSPVRPGREYNLTLEYANTGDADMLAPLFILTSSVPVRMKPLGATDWFTGTVYMLGVNPGRPAGVLPLNTQGSIPVQFQAINQAVTFHLNSFTGDDTAVDWDTYKDSMRPGSISSAEWNALWPALTTQLGPTWGDYISVMGDDAERLRLRSDPDLSVAHLLSLEIQKAKGEPVAVISGQLHQAETDSPLTNATLIARSATGEIVRKASTDAVYGRFTVADLPDGRYDMMAEGYYFSPTVTVEITHGLDVTGLTLAAVPIPTPPAPEPPRVMVSNPQLLAVGAQTHLTYVENGQVYHAVHNGSAWGTAVPVEGAQGSEPKLLYSPTLLDGTTPGLALFWRSGTGNGSVIQYAAARQTVLENWAWSQVMTYTQPLTGAAVLNPTTVINSDGNPLVMWQLVDVNDLNADTDLYYDSQPLSSSTLNWSQIKGVLVLDRPTRLTTGSVLPVGTAIALTGAGQAYVMTSWPPAAPAWQVNFDSAFAFEKKTSVPKYIPYIGGQNLVQWAATLHGDANESQANASGSLTGNVSVLDGRLTGTAAGNLSARWVLDNKTCRFHFDHADLTTSLGVSGKFPIPALTWTGWWLNVEVGLQGAGTLSGHIIWTGQGGAWPDGVVTGNLQLGAYGEIKFLGGSGTATVNGTGNLNLQIDKTGFNVTDAYFSISGQACLVGQNKLCWDHAERWPAETTRSRQSYPGLDLAVQAALGSPSTVTDTLSLRHITGTTVVYPGTSVLSEVGVDLIDDGGPVLATTTAGVTYAVWPRPPAGEPDSFSTQIVYATYSGSAWSAPQIMTGTDGFNRALTIQSDDAGGLLLVWGHSAASGFTLSSDPHAVMTATQRSDIWYAYFTPAGGWSAPAVLAANPGKALNSLTLGQGVDGLWAAWVSGDSAPQTLYAAHWTGIHWSTPEVIASANILGNATLQSLGNTTSLLWVQGVDDGVDDVNHHGASRFYVASFQYGVWTAPVELILATAELFAATSSSVSDLLAPTSGDANFILSLTPPANVCQPEPPMTPPNPPQPPDTDHDGTGTTTPVQPSDPNEKSGPAGLGTQHVVRSGDELSYVIYFENVVTATAPAQEVIVTDYLDPNLDWTTLRVTDIAWGDQSLNLPGDSPVYASRLAVSDYRPGITKTWWVDLNVGMNPLTGRLRWTLRTLDPETGELPVDPLAGFLPPNDATGRGEGHVSFTIRPRADAPVGTSLTNSAGIVFDTNEAIETNQVRNTLGVIADLAITQSAHPNPVAVGRALTYTLRVTNDGPDAATGVVITDTLPVSMTFGSAASSQGSCNLTPVIVCNLGTVQTGASVTATIVVTPTLSGVVTNMASVSSNVFEADALDNNTVIATSVIDALHYKVFLPVVRRNR